jgi:hypothetical protein
MTGELTAGGLMRRFLSLIVLIFALSACTTQHQNDKFDILKSNINPITESSWKIGGKIHFEEVSGADYIGLNEINEITKNTLKTSLKTDDKTISKNAKILLEKQPNTLIMTDYEEKSRPGTGEELHATLLYTSPRGFHTSETLHQVCCTLFKECHTAPQIEDVAKAYTRIISESNLKFKISEIIFTKSDNGPAFIMAKLLFNEHDVIYKKAFNSEKQPISAGLHMALVNCEGHSIFSDSCVIKSIIKKLNKELSGKTIQVAVRQEIIDLEFGLSGQPWRIRAGKRMELQTK